MCLSTPPSVTFVHKASLYNKREFTEKEIYIRIIAIGSSPLRFYKERSDVKIVEAPVNGFLRLPRYPPHSLDVLWDNLDRGVDP